MTITIDRLNLVVALLIAAAPFTASAAPVAEGWNALLPGSTGAPQATVIRETDRFLEVRWTIPGFGVHMASTPAGSFQRLTLWEAGVTSRSGPGEPELPLATRMIRLPDATRGRVEVVKVDWVEFDNALLTPRQIPRRDGGATPPPFVYDAASYASPAAVPTEFAGVTTPQGWSGESVAAMWVTPFRYQPAARILEVAREVVVRVWFDPDPGVQTLRPTVSSPVMSSIHRAALLNPPAEPPVRDDADEPEPVRLLVVLRHEALETVAPLIELHRNSGLRTIVWEIDGDVEAVEIKDRIRELYGEGLEFVLFVGDGDSASPDVPMFFWDDGYPGRQLPEGEETASGSDSWYSCLDPEDRDGFDDHLPDIAVGRLVYDSVNDLGQLAIQVAKLTDYIGWGFEQQDAAWLNRGLLIGHKDFDAEMGGYFYINCKIAVEVFDYRLAAPEFTTAYGNQQGIDNNFVVQQIDNGVGFVNYRGHGDNTIWWRWDRGGENFSTATVGRLNNRQQPFIFVSSACLNANIYGYRGTCLLEAFQKRSGGSLSAHGSVISTFTDGNSLFDITIFPAFFDDGIYNIGYAANLAAAEMVTHFDAQGQNGYPVIGRVNLRAYIWMGDPALEYRLQTPTLLAEDVPPVVPIGTRTFEVMVTYGGQVPFPGARVIVRTADDTVYRVGQSDAEGRAVLNFDEPLEGPVELLVTASHREAKPITEAILVADAFGVIEGLVTRSNNNAPVGGAVLTLSRFNAETISDAGGFYRLRGVPAGAYRLTIAARGLIGQARDLNVGDADTTRLDFALDYSRLELGAEQVSERLDSDDTSLVALAFSNSGNGRLEWSAAIRYVDRRQPFEQILEFLPGLDVGDTRINGAVFADGLFYIAGGNNNRDPNYIYVFDRDGAELPDLRIEQPRMAAGFGFHDLEYDGSLIYGSADTRILAVTTEGEVVDTIQGPYDPNTAIALDPDGSIWVGNNRAALAKTDRGGNVLATVPVNFYVRGLTWYPDGADGFRLLAWGRPGDIGVLLYGVKPETGEIRLLRNLSLGEAEDVADGLSATLEYDPTGWTLLAMVSDGDARIVRTLHLGPRSGWVTVSPETGAVMPQQEGEVALRFDATGIPEGVTLQSLLAFIVNAEEERVEVPLELLVGPVFVAGDNSNLLPEALTLTGLYPNPFNSTLTVEVALPRAGMLKVGIYDAQGRLLRAERQGQLGAGLHRLALDAKALPAGVYLLRAESAGSVAVGKAVLLR